MVLSPAADRYVAAWASLVREFGPQRAAFGLPCCEAACLLDRRAYGLDADPRFAKGGPWWNAANITDGRSPLSDVAAACEIRPADVHGSTDLPLNPAVAPDMASLRSYLTPGAVVRMQIWHAWDEATDLPVLAKGGHTTTLLVQPDGLLVVLESAEATASHPEWGHGMRIGGVVGATSPDAPGVRHERFEDRVRSAARVGLAVVG